MLRPRRITKKLTCAHCGDVIADAVYRPLAGWLTITSPSGYELPPQQAALHYRRAEQELTAASSSAEEEQARSHIEFIKRNVGELMYSLPCHRGHYTLATAPRITRAMRHTQGNWVRLSEHSR